MKFRREASSVCMRKCQKRLQYIYLGYLDPSFLFQVILPTDNISEGCTEALNKRCPKSL